MRDAAEHHFGGNSRTARLLWAFAAVCSAILAHSANAQTQQARMSAAEREVRVTDSTRFAAMTHSNLAALDTLLGADLTYTHNDGSRESKSELMADIRSKDLVYLGLRPDSVTVRVNAATAIEEGRVLIRARSGTQQGSFTARFLEVYEKRAGHWELVAWQSTRLTPIVLEK